MAMDVVWMYVWPLLFTYSLVIPVSIQGEDRLRCKPHKDASRLRLYAAATGYDIWLADPWKENSDPGVKGDSATKRSKPATLETGLIVQVPEYLSQGERVKVDTRTGDYLSRA